MKRQFDFTATSKGFTGWDQYYKPLQYIIMENALTIQQIHTVICYKWNYLKKKTTIPLRKKNAKLKLSFLIVQTFSKSTSHKLNIFFNKNVSFLLHCSKYDFITFTHFTSMFLSYFNDFLKIWDTSIVCFRSSSLRDKVFKNGSSKICVRQPLKI